MKKLHLIAVIALVGAMILSACGAQAAPADTGPAVSTAVAMTVQAQAPAAKWCDLAYAGLSFNQEAGTSKTWTKADGTSFTVTLEAGSCNILKIQDPASGQPPSATSAPTATNATPVPTALHPFFPKDDGDGPAVYGRISNDPLIPACLPVSVAYRGWRAISKGTTNDFNLPWMVLFYDPMINGTAMDMYVLEPTMFQFIGNGQLTFGLSYDIRNIEQLRSRGIDADPWMQFCQDAYCRQTGRVSVYFKGSGKIMNVHGQWVELGSQSFWQVELFRDKADAHNFQFDFGKAGNVRIWLGGTELTGTGGLHSPIDLPVIKCQ